jgi:hypothetical protein
MCVIFDEFSISPKSTSFFIVLSSIFHKNDSIVPFQRIVSRFVTCKVCSNESFIFACATISALISSPLLSPVKTNILSSSSFSSQPVNIFIQSMSSSS